MILKFNFYKEVEKIKQNEINNYAKLNDKNRKDLEDERMGHLSLGIKEYEDISNNFIMKSFISSAEIERVVRISYMKDIAKLSVASIEYVSAILASKKQKTSGYDVRDFLTKFSDQSQRNIDFIEQWIKIRNRWMHEGEFNKDKNFIDKYYSTKGHLIVLEDFFEIIIPIFKQIEEAYPGEDLDAPINIGEIPSII